MGATIKIETGEPGAIKRGLNQAGWLDEEVVAAGQLRQGKAPSTLAMVTGAGLIELLRPRRSKSLPRHFVLAVTTDRITAFKASGGSRESDNVYELRVKPQEQGSWPRSEVRMVDLPKGRESEGGMLKLGIESLPVARPNLSGDPSTDELIELLST